MAITNSFIGDGWRWPIQLDTDRRNREWSPAPPISSRRCI